MIRIVAIVLIALAIWMLLAGLVARLKRADIDWTGVAAFVGFVALAFWLRHVTGMG
jgi:hypothetical protein